MTKGSIMAMVFMVFMVFETKKQNCVQSHEKSHPHYFVDYWTSFLVDHGFETMDVGFCGLSLWIILLMTQKGDVTGMVVDGRGIITCYY